MPTKAYILIETDPLVTLLAPQQVIDDKNDCQADQANRQFKKTRHEYHRQNIAGGITEKFKNLAVKYNSSYNQAGQYPKPEGPDPTPLIRFIRFIWFIWLSETLAHAMQAYRHKP